jgi:5-methylthioadenosine/S-adenosylhomocysteine deaminase
MMNILIKNVDVIISGSEQNIIRNGNIGIQGDTILFVNAGGNTPPGFNPDKVIDGKNRLAMPGLVNAHTHSSMTLLRNFADDLALEEWLFNRIIPLEAKLGPEDIYWGTMLAIAEMIKSGTTCFADMYLHMDEVARAVLESGIRANISKGPLVSNLRGKPGISVDSEGCMEYFKTWNNQGNGRIKTCVEIHSVYLYDEISLREAAELAKKLNAGIHIHVLETEAERNNSIRMYGMNPAEACLEFGIFDVPVIAAHCVHLSDSDMEILKSRNVNAVHNPSSNLKLGSGIARVPDMLDRGINVCLGTDGAASNNNLNMFEEMHLAALLHKGVQCNPTLMNAKQVLKMATANGASALGFGDDTGYIDEGMKADIILLDIDKPHLCPVNNPISAVVYSAQGSDVDTVIINGEVVMENRKLLTIDEEKVKYKVKEIAARLSGLR